MSEENKLLLIKMNFVMSIKYLFNENRTIGIVDDIIFFRCENTYNKIRPV